MNEKNAFVFVVDDDTSIRDSLKDLISGSDLELPLAELAQPKALPAAVSSDYSTTLREAEREHILRALISGAGHAHAGV